MNRGGDRGGDRDRRGGDNQRGDNNRGENRGDSNRGDNRPPRREGNTDIRRDDVPRMPKYQEPAGPVSFCVQ